VRLAGLAATAGADERRTGWRADCADGAGGTMMRDIAIIVLRGLGSRAGGSRRYWA